MVTMIGCYLGNSQVIIIIVTIGKQFAIIGKLSSLPWQWKQSLPWQWNQEH